MEMNDIEIGDWLHSMHIYDYDICDGIVHVVGGVNLYNRGLTSIPVQFGYVSGDFFCYGNDLDSLEGCPNEVGGYFDCSSNNLTSLEGCPSVVGGYFLCYGNLFKNKPDFSHIRVGGDFGW
jgi:hypothetical protein